MDSLTQIVLGAAVGEAVLGKKLGNRAMLWGAIAGTIPDLDVLLRFLVDEITATEMHRGFSHSLVFAILMAPILGFVVHKIHKKRTEVSFKNWTQLFFWTIVTHPLLDAHTTWGTQFFWPFEYRLAYQNIFVVDPFYTLPFLVFTLIAMFHKRTNPRRQKFNRAGLIVSTSYMLLTLLFKWIAHNEFEQQLAANKIDYIELDTKPTPLNTILWNAQVKTEDGYLVAYYSLFDDKEIEFSFEYKQNYHLIAPYADQKVIKQLLKISAGWYFVEEVTQNELLFWDLRFGQAGFDIDSSPFLFCYTISINDYGKVTAKREDPNMENVGEIFSELIARIKGN